MLQGKIFWTEHAKLKMRQYGLSRIKLINLLRRPERREEGIAPGTRAAMQTNKTFAKKVVGAIRPAGEIWLMYTENKEQCRVISAWRYPGISTPGEQIPIPKDIREQLLEEGY